MSKVVFILGAGASRAAGGPLMSDFLDKAEDLIDSGRAGVYKDRLVNVFRVLKGLEACHSKARIDLNNIESVLSILELGLVLERVPGVEPAEIPDAIEDLKRLIVVTLEQSIRFPQDQRGYVLAPEPYPAFVQLVKALAENGKETTGASVVTFNYDLAVDVAFHRERLTANYYLTGEAESKGGTPLLKLHGSLNWYGGGDNGCINAVSVAEYLKERQSPGGGALTRGDLPIIVPPSWDKADHQRRLSTVWRAAAKHLQEAQSVFIVGYSLPETDSFFRQLFALGTVGGQRLRRLTVYNPDKGVEARFRDLLGPTSLSRFSFEPLKFDKAVGDMRSKLGLS